MKQTTITETMTFIVFVAIYYTMLWLLFSLIAWINPLDIHEGAKVFAVIIAIIAEIWQACARNEKKLAVR
jgi:hypothetical protein